MPLPTVREIPVEPFIDWLYEQMETLAKDETLRLHEQSRMVPTRKILADRLGVSERCVFRYLRGLDGNNKPTTTFRYDRVADMLDHAGVPFWQLYPDHDEGPVEPEIFCPSCRVDVTPINNRCAWCGSRPGKRPRGLTRKRPQQKISDEQLRILHELHVRWRLPIIAIARQSWQRLGYATAGSCDQAIRYGFRKHGLALLSRSQIMRAWNERREIPLPFTEEQLRRAVDLHRAGASAYAIAKAMIAESRYHCEKALDRWLIAYFREQGIYRDRRRPIEIVMAELDAGEERAA